MKEFRVNPEQQTITLIDHEHMISNGHFDEPVEVTLDPEDIALLSGLSRAMQAGGEEA